MSRAVWKGPFVDPSLIKKVEKLKGQANKAPIKTWSRKSTIIPEFVGISFLIYNGKKFIPIKISEEMVGHKLGEFSPTRQFIAHTAADKKAAEGEAAAVGAPKAAPGAAPKAAPGAAPGAAPKATPAATAPKAKEGSGNAKK
tara:strand:+ start:687 stop:1112 length:426 start_codon:yes stop_codon:yes gene_type:complete